jgi:transketolase
MPNSPATSPSGLDALCINAVRTLAMDAVQKANSGHPGTPMALAPLCYVLWTRHLRHNPADPSWPNRDRFVLSAGHASMLLYSLLHLTGYDLSRDDLQSFRQWRSRTPGHPEHGQTPGVETTTGPLGQGVGNAVGMALAQARLAAEFDRPGLRPIDHHVYFVASDGDLMEGVAHEAASLAGHLRLSRLIGFYDDNAITIEGPTRLAFSEDVARRFEAYGWSVLHVENANDLEAIDRAIVAAQGGDRPALVIVRSHIAFGSPNKQDTAEAHGAPLGADEVRLTKQNLGWPSLDPFFVPEAALAVWRQCVGRGAELQARWEETFAAYARAHPDAARELRRRWRRELPAGWDRDLPVFDAANGALATRAASGKVLNAIARRLPELIGGSADLAPSTNTLVDGEADFAAGDAHGRNLRFGIREHGMGAVLNGMALYGGFVPYGATFLVFSDYMRPAIRLAALMDLHVVYVFTHDSIGLGEDGPTHQPIEQLAALRLIPNLRVVRPADSGETVEAWRFAMQHDGPVVLALTRQKVPYIDRNRYAPAEGLARGAYVLSEAAGGVPEVVLLASGSEVSLVLAAQEQLVQHGVAARVVSAPCLELFAAQPRDYRDQVLPPGVPARVAVEAAHPMAWQRWVGEAGRVVGIEHFGASAPYESLMREFGFTPDHVVSLVLDLLGR